MWERCGRDGEHQVEGTESNPQENLPVQSYRCRQDSVMTEARGQAETADFCFERKF